MRTPATDRTVGVLLPRDLPADRILPYARRAEELGFGSVWVVEDLGFRGGVAQAAAVLASTERIRVGIGLLPAGARNVAFAALEIASLAQLFPGRVDVAVGHGMPHWMRSVGQWPRSPLALLREYVDALRALLRGELTQRRGQYVHLDGVQLDPSALPGIVPDILAGVRGPKSLAVSGEVADGTVLAEPVAPEYARAALGHIAADRPHRLVAYNVASVDADRGTALAAARPALEWIGEPDWHAHIAPLPFADELVELRAGCADRSEFVRRLPDDQVARLAVAGTPQEARARLDGLWSAGVTDSVLAPVGPDPVAALGSLATVLDAA
ncbi:LLM class flavin-dependent oxidoreductase [Streptomyces griseus]|uniref:LLM class flavin-dependent oxidoreductase n=1 Tax=Streptomyces griseus TaxID=1911 RepID=UPI00386412D0|nr:LLM class flavin-dependent oxidoreductase [Streptomyces fimicarius]WTC91921.1 LLM class flavin-dependent oxidoreductase [Streptomyces griseus]WTD65446.1 LLM class flavin-dependent oxidoreductase [Streptomyces griseus]